LQNNKKLNLSIGQKLIAVLPPAVFIVSLIFLFGPFNIYKGNISEFAVSLSSILALYLLPALALLSLLIGIGLLLPNRLHMRYVSVIFVIGVLIWLQGNILVWKYGLLDGQGFDWTKDQWRGWVDGGLWLLLLAGGFFFYKKVHRIVLLGCISLICLQSAYLGVNSFQYPETWKNVSQEHYPPDEIYDFSSKENVFQFILDAFQSDIFQDIIEEDPDYYKKELEGFTFFKETTASFPTTYMSVPAILSGKNYKNHIPMLEFVKKTLNGKTITNVLYDKGYDIDLVHGGGRRYFEGRFSNAFWPGRLYAESKYHFIRGKAALMLDLVLFRYAPHLLKNAVYNNQSWLVQPLIGWTYASQLILSHRTFLRDIVSNMSANRTKPVYKLIHIMTTHRPLVFNESCEYAGKVFPFTRENLKIHLKCGLDSAIEFFRKLKSLSIYDASLIILHADHGAGMKAQLETRDKEGDLDTFINSVDFTRIVGSALPLLAIKPPHSGGPLKVSDAQAMLTDIPATISSILNLNEDFPGRSVFEIGLEEVRERKTYYYKWRRENWQADYFNRLDEYIVKGSVFNVSSWRPGLTFYPPGKLIKTKEIDFGTDKSSDFKRYGWGGNEWSSGGKYAFNWALGRAASISVSLPKYKPVFLTANIQSYPFNKPQHVTIKVDGQEIGSWELRPPWRRSKHSIVIEPKEDRPDVSTVEFVFSQHMTPEEGTRPVSVLFESIMLSKLTFHELGTTIQFGKGGNALSYIQKGWSGPANGYTWTNGQSASINIPITIPDSPSITLRVNLRAFLGDGKVEKQTVIILVNGMRVGSWVITTPGFKDKRVTIPKSFLTLPYLLDITFLMPNAVSPSTVGYNEDKRVLGVAVRTIDLYE